MNKDRMAVLAALMDQGVIPVFYHKDPEICIKVIEACSAGGAKCIEFTNRGDYASYTFLDVAKVCNRRKIAYSPGCGSASEISYAEELGCEIVKVFPGTQVGGPEFVKSVLGPMPWTRIMPTGGVDPDETSVKAWFSAGIVAAGMGSKLITKEALDAQDYKGIENKVRETIALIKKYKKVY